MLPRLLNCLLAGSLLLCTLLLVALELQAAPEDAAETTAETEQQPARAPDAAAKEAPGEEAGGEGAPGEEAHGDGESGHGGHGAHDETDLSHGNATAALYKPEQFKWDLAIYTFVVFVLLLLLLLKFAWGPIMAGLAKREQSIANMIDEARQNADRAEQRLREYEARLASAAEESRHILDEAHRAAEGAKEKIVAEAQAAARRERDRAVADIQTAKNLALQDIARQGTEIAVHLAGQIVHRELRREDHARLITDALEKLPSPN